MTRKRGRPPKPLALHVLNGSYRKDRHGPLPEELARNLAPSVREAAAMATNRTPAVDSMPTTGDELMAAIQADWLADDPIGQLYVRMAGAALDRRRALATALDGPAGLLASLVAGKAGISAKALEVLLRAERWANEDLATAIQRLHLEDVPATAAARERVS